MAGQGHSQAVRLGASEGATCEKTGGSGKQWQPWTPEHPYGGQGSWMGSVLPFLAGRQYFTAISELEPSEQGYVLGKREAGMEVTFSWAGLETEAVTVLVMCPWGKGKQ